MRPFLATNTILSVLPVCSLHVHMKVIAHANNLFDLSIIFTRAPVNFMWAQTWVAMPGVAMPLVLHRFMSHSISTQSSVHRPCCHSLAGTSSSTVKRFNHILVTSVAFLLCVWHVNSRSAYILNSVQLRSCPPFFKLVAISFQKSCKSVFLVKFVVSYTSAHAEFIVLHDCGRNARNVAKWVF